MRPKYCLPFVSLSLSALLGAQTSYAVLRGDTLRPRIGTMLGHGRADLDRDGFPDLLVAGAHAAGNTVIVCSGHTASVLDVLRGPNAAEYGAALAWVGDLDGDGLPDFLVGAPGDLAQGAGAAFVYASRGRALVREHQGATAGARLGAALVGIGDFDRDGRADYAVGAPGESGRGAVRIHSGATGAMVRTFAGTAPGAGFGSALAALPDLDGDGLQDLAIGIPGGTRGEVVIVATASTATLRRHTGPAGIPGFGSVLAEVGDLDGDGKVDLAVGVPDAYANGVVVTYSSATGALLHAILGRSPGDRFGASLAAAGDVDRDGKADFAVGSPGADAGTQLELGRVEVFSGATGGLRVAVLGTTPGGSSGASLAALGDVDGDGRAELAVGAPAADAGLVTLLAPHDLAIAATPLTLPLASGGAQRLEIDFGTAAAGHTYLVLGSSQGIDPGVTIGSVHVPLVPDGYLLGLLLAPNQPPLTASFGPLSVAGTGVTTFTLPASLPPVFLGLTLHHAALHFDGARLVAASSAVPVQLVGTATGVRTAGEEFASANQLDLARSSGSWSAGQARTGTLGGDGILGDFQASDGRSLGAGVYEWNTDSQRIPGARTLTGKDIDVTDGVFRFATFHVPAGTTVRFVGSQPARILVRGSVTVAGIVESNGQTTQMVDTASANGQPGSRGGAGGGAGGQGSDRCTGLGYEPRFDGQAGGDVGLLPGHAYAARAVGTGGRGSRVFPTAATNASVTFKYQGNQACGMVPAAGGSGGARSAGGVGRATLSPSNELGPQAAGGSAFDPFPLPPFVASFEHFLVAGAGGGGGGSHPFYSYAVTGVRWRAGGAGGGGGGALGFRVGRDLEISAGATISCRGGSAPFYTLTQHVLGPPAASGAGSGGSVVLHVGERIVQNGTLDVRGGTGGSWDLSVLNATASAGPGSAGFVRLERRTLPSVTELGTTQPPASTSDVGAIQGPPDPDCAQLSLWYPVGRPHAPRFVRYEVETSAGRFSDDPARGTLARYGSSEPLWFLAQGAKLDRVTKAPVPGSERGMRTQVGRFVSGEPSLDDDAAEAFRFVLVFHDPLLVVHKVTLFVEG